MLFLLLIFEAIVFDVKSDVILFESCGQLVSELMGKVDIEI